ncbi:phosphate-repressible phosphate permease [Leptomonas pyrrhocoris]|uniref:Phosphate transporter n=1 Tax=Leptomonas pyrrhocoris TaxID=157538 RepID=A0A0N0VDG1_LEPPY|nr:phosphate-repressible phosphate permease [Leptomonas pyrrhocoris]KPA75428.1 phosphate-repressible phosphate permease [Leptomonas pyrrhocoris]|eukprot:XP_015653867.1 phosphate-repressible phosphate permease [Leptomonas pyrrhocoris]
MATVYPYIWIVIVGAFVSFLTGAGVGMNDLSNAFGTTYGAKVLTLTQIVILASICEFAGAVSLGGAVTATISGGIANPSDFADHPYIFMYGMLCACGAAFCWLALATWLTLPVSSTHSICGGVIGFALVYGGGGSVSWADHQDEFPFVGGVVPIIASWFISPLLTGAVAAIIYGSVRFLVLRPANSVQRAIYSLPIIVTIAFFLEAFFVLYKGAKSRLHWDVSKAAWVAAVIAVAAGVISCAFIPLLKRRVARMGRKAAELAQAEGRPMVDVEAELVRSGYDDNEDEGRTSRPVSHLTRTDEEPAAARMDEGRKKGEATTGDVVRDEAAEDSDDNVSLPPAQPPTASGLEVQMFNTHAEMVYRFLQIFTAICASFAHGASDVSNAVGPLAAIYSVYTTGTVASSSSIPVWVLCLGGAGLVVGLATFGIRLMRLLGEKLTVITPSRGFSAELSAALVVSFASGYGIPVSSTHCITGAVIAISMMDVGVCRVRWMMVLKMYGGWVFTLVITAIMSATFFAQGINSPSL